MAVSNLTMVTHIPTPFHSLGRHWKPQREEPGEQALQVPLDRVVPASILALVIIPAAHTVRRHHHHLVLIRGAELAPVGVAVLRQDL